MVYYYFTLRELLSCQSLFFAAKKDDKSVASAGLVFLCVSSFSVFRQQQTYLNITDFGTRIVNTKYI